MTIDVVIPTWNKRELLLRCLELLEADGTPHTTYVVDNASGDGSAEAVEERFPDVRVIRMPRNAGFGAAVNAGARAGSGEAIVVLNNDVEVEPGFLARLVAPLAAEERVGSVASLTTIPGDGGVDAYGLEIDEALFTYCRMRGESPANGDARGVLAGPSGSAGAYRRSAYESVGGFDENLFAYGEDIDLALRLRAAGWSAGAAPDARAVHLGGATTGLDSPWQRDLAGFARGYLVRAYGLHRTRAAVRVAFWELAIVLWGLLRFRTLVPLRSRIRGWRAARGERRALPAEAVNRAIGWGETLHRFRNVR